jgi:hypothetical protein
VRGDGGYVLAAPSVLDDGRSYRWYRDVPAVPMSLDFKHALEQVLETLRQRRQGRGGGPAGVNAGGSLGQLCGAVRAAPSGERNNILHWAACRAAEAVLELGWNEDEAAAELHDAYQASGGMDAAGAWRTIRSGMRMNRVQD